MDAIHASGAFTYPMFLTYPMLFMSPSTTPKMMIPMSKRSAAKPYNKKVFPVIDSTSKQVTMRTTNPMFLTYPMLFMS